LENHPISDFGSILLFLLGGALFVTVAMTAARMLRPNRPNPEKLSPYECGEDAVGTPWANFNARFYIIALIFILFEVEIIFLFPWATVSGNAEMIKESNGLWGWFAVIEVFLFIGVLLLGLAYAWAKGFLDWIKPKPEAEEFKSPVPPRLYEEVNNRYK